MQQNDKHLDEYVMVFPSNLLINIGNFQGLSFEVQKYLNNILNPKNHLFLKRKEAEKDPSYKQLIPYVILHCGKSVFTYRRGKLLSEKRLLGNYSIGIGGHISVNDPALFGTTYEEGLKREVNEEIVIESNYTKKVAALINDDSNEVGRVHFGVVHTFSIEKPLIKAKEKSINEAMFMGIEELKNQINKFENWSKICIQNIQSLLK